MHLCLGNLVETGGTVVHNARAFSAGIKCRHCTLHICSVRCMKMIDLVCMKHLKKYMMNMCQIYKKDSKNTFRVLMGKHPHGVPFESMIDV